MVAPIQTFGDSYKTTKTSQGNYSIRYGENTTYTAQDYADSAGDDLTRLGDIANDHFAVTSGRGASFNAVYVGQTPGGGVVFKAFGGYYLLTNNTYTSGQTFTDTATPYTVVTCYVSGTMIRIARGQEIVDVAVEALRVGDLAVTSSGAHRPIRWLGSRTMDCRHHPRPHEAMPVRITAHAFGEDRPARDLLVSPGHSICVNVVEDVLIPASSLVNGTTVQQVEVDEVTYWHVELDSHDVILAENLAAESYIEMGNRGFFREADVVSLDALPDATLEARTHADFCRPFHSEGPIVDVVRSHLRTRRATLGWTLQHEPMADLHLIADGVRIEPAIRDLTARFSVPAGARDVWLVSNTSRPCEISDSIDVRDLGIYLTGLAIDDGFDAPCQIDMSDPLLCVGFHALEDGMRRWTAGRARLPAALWEDCPEGFFLRIELGVPALPRWVAPVETMVARRAA